MGQVAPGGSTRIGIANASWNYTQSEMLGQDTNSFAYGSDGSIFVAGSSVGSAESFAAADIVQLCADFGAQLFWVTKNDDGNWNGTSADPAAGTGGIGFSSIPGPHFAGYCSAIAGDSVTANFGASAFSYTPPSGFSAWGGGFGGGIRRPAALANYPDWKNYRDWRFGTNSGNNIKKLSDLRHAKWVDSHDTDNNDDVEIQEFTMSMNDDNPNVQVLDNHCDFLAIWDGNPIPPPPPNGGVTSMQVELPLDLAIPSLANGNPTLTSVAYVEGTFRCPNVNGAWPAWWTIGHQIGGQPLYVTWGPEIDIMEIEGPEQLSEFDATLHARNNAENECFRNDGDHPNPNIPPGTVDYDNSGKGNVAYCTAGAGVSNLGYFHIKNVIDAADGFHRYGCLIEPDHTISIWIDDQKIGHFDATQYCDDHGTPVAVQLLIDLALSNDAGIIDPTNFGGPNNIDPNNKFRLSIKDVQIWGPPPP